jgi:hypothetical protein
MLNQMMRSILIIFFVQLLNTSLSFAADSLWYKKPTLKLTLFTDVFYVYDFNKPQTTKRQRFLFNHNRHNEFNLNLGLIKLDIQQQKYRANLSLQTGTYASDNYSSEPLLLKNIFQASTGLSLNQKNNLWIDAGILPSHIGFESAISTDNLTLTRSLAAENSPYFLTGAKITYQPNSKLKAAVLMVNGWQRIQRLKGNSLPSFGTQINYKINTKLTLNWSTFFGTDTPDINRLMRYFSNFYASIKPSKKIKILTGFDIGYQQKFKHSDTYSHWYNLTVIGQYSFSEKWKTALRIEHFQDIDHVIIMTNNLNDFKTTGVSLNLDYKPAPFIYCRIEGRYLNNSSTIFATEQGFSRSNLIIATSLAFKFADFSFQN